MTISRVAARALETGRWDGLVTRAIASAVTAPLMTRGLVRRATVPEDVALVCVGGATLGGSGKTRVAIACARELARSRRDIVLVGHAYRAALGEARVVTPNDAVEVVGDEAIVCARALAEDGVRVVIGPSRQHAIDHALTLRPRPSVLVLDGPLRVSGASRTLALLAVDARCPWGSGRLPPAGDLRAPRARLLAVADHVVSVDAMPTAVRWSERTEPLSSLRGLRLGLFTALARPDRLVRALASAGVAPSTIVSVADHGPVPRALRAQLEKVHVDAWICTEKCALHLDLGGGTRLGVLVAELVTLTDPVVRALTMLTECATHLHSAP